MPTRKQLAAQLAALNAKIAKDVAAAQAEIDTTNATIAAANQPVVEEMPERLVGLPGNIPVPSMAAINQSIENNTLLPGVLKEGFTEGTNVPAEALKALNVKELPDILGWRIVTDANGTERLEVQTGIGESQTYGAAVGGNMPTPGGNTTGAGGAGGLTLVSTNVDPKTGAVIGYFSDGSSKVLTQGGLSKVETDAYAMLEDTFRNYGLESLVPIIKGYMQANLGTEQAALQLKQTKEYKTRFAGNQIRLAAGQNALSEAEYLNLENSYINTLAAYGLSGYFGKDRTSQVAGMANVIGGDVSATEFADRVNTVVTEVQQGDPRIKGMLKAYYNIDDADIVNYYLNPTKDNLAALKQKTLSAEIGAAGALQGLGVQKTTAEALAAQGVTQQQAIQGYKTVAEVLPTTTKLSDIYNEAGVGYNQAAAEAEVFGTTGAASAQRKRRQLAELEAAAFGGKSGRDENSLGKSLTGRF